MSAAGEYRSCPPGVLNRGIRLEGEMANKAKMEAHAVTARPGEVKTAFGKEFSRKTFLKGGGALVVGFSAVGVNGAPGAGAVDSAFASSGPPDAGQVDA